MRTCTYTVLLGGYDNLLPQPVATDSTSDFICFTDDPDLTSDTWQIQLIDPRFPQDLHRSSRVPKILGHERLREYDATLCIDASVRLRARPEVIIDEWLPDGSDIALAAHSYRDQVVDELDEVVRLNYDDRARVYEQLVDYSLAYPDVLEAKPHWGGMIVRRTSARVDAAMRLWFDHVLRYSRRDQLSLMVALLHGGATYTSIGIDNFESEYHEWPVITGRRVQQGKAPALPSGPVIAELRRASRRVDELEAVLLPLEGRAPEEVVSTLRERESEASQLRDLTDDLSVRLETAESELEQLQGVRGAVRHLRRAAAERFRREGR